jgi:uncharacterized protein YndB with AHSA1/START domain
MVRHDTFTISRHLDVPPGEVFTACADTAIRWTWRTCAARACCD